jgi:hypothetical protein
MKHTTVERRRFAPATLWLLGAVLWAAAGLALAQESIPWDRLTPEQQTLLHKAEPRWDQLPPEKQRRLLRGAERWSQMSEQDRARAKHRVEQWQSLPPEQRKALREKVRRFHELPPEQRERLRGLRDDFRALPKETQQQFRDCQHRKRADATLDCRSLWPQALRDKYADLPDLPPKPRTLGRHEHPPGPTR